MRAELIKTLKTSSLVMLVVAVVGSGLLSFTNFFTADQIELNHKLMLLKTFNQIIRSDTYDNDPVEDTRPIPPDIIFRDKTPIAHLLKKNNKIIAVFLQTTARDGYSGEIRLLVAVKQDKTLAGVRVLTHKETPGLGDNIEVRKSDWIKSFTHKSLQNPVQNKWQVKKDGGEFDQFTGATITPRAIVKTVRQTLVYVDKHYQEIFHEQE